MAELDWFETLTGFREASYDTTKAQLELLDGQIRSRINGRVFKIGQLETPSLGELRIRGQLVAAELEGRLNVKNLLGDVRQLHANPASAGSLFQVASQFNLLEMSGPELTPEDGVTRYAWDHTQGPACAVAAGAATIYRNYFASVGAQQGQSRTRQIDCLTDLGAALGNEQSSLWRMQNGYALGTLDGLARVNSRLLASGSDELATLRDLLRVGLHWNVGVTDSNVPDIIVSQIFCSAMPVSYSDVPSAVWEPFARLILEAAYEATLWAAMLNFQASGSRIVYLTLLGGGAFGNPLAWILDALERALQLFVNIGLEVRLVSYSSTPPELVRLIRQFI